MDPRNPSSKERVIHRLLALLAEYVSLSEATLATMGGAGLEAGCWGSLHIPPSNSWLIEQDRGLMRSLRKALPGMHTARQLTAFPASFQKVLGERAPLDLFHLDLCGTVETTIRDLTGVLPFLLNGRGRILAITMADQRTNRALSETKLMQTVCKRLFGNTWNALCENLVGLHEQESIVRKGIVASPEKVALREIGALLYLLLAFTAVRREGTKYDVRTQRFPLMHFLRFRSNGEQRSRRLIEKGETILLPDRIERFVYWSETRHFRMRTIAFHLESLAAPLPLMAAAERLANMVMKSPYTIVDGNKMHSIWHQRPRTQRDRSPTVPPAPSSATQITSTRSSTIEEIDMAAGNGASAQLRNDVVVAAIRKRFAPFLGAMNDALTSDFETLCVLALTGGTDARMSLASSHLANALEALRGTAPTPPHTTTPPAPAPKAVKKKGRATKGHDQGPKSGTLTVDQTDDIRIEMLTAKRKGKAAYKAKRAEICTRLDPTNTGTVTKLLGSILSHAYGKFTPSFVARNLLRLPATQRDARLKELAQLFGLSVKPLRKKMEASPTWQHAMKAAPLKATSRSRNSSVRTLKGFTIGSTKLDTKETDDLRLRLLEASNTGADAYAKLRDEVLTSYGVPTSRENMRKIGGLMAGVMGRCRPAFVMRVIARIPEGERDAKLNTLASLCKVAPTTLRKEMSLLH